MLLRVADQAGGLLEDGEEGAALLCGALGTRLSLNTVPRTSEGLSMGITRRKKCRTPFLWSKAARKARNCGDQGNSASQGSRVHSTSLLRTCVCHPAFSLGQGILNMLSLLSVYSIYVLFL